MLVLGVGVVFWVHLGVGVHVGVGFGLGLVSDLI